jgi:lipid A ethanolaminephosphotransferase
MKLHLLDAARRVPKLRVASETLIVLGIAFFLVFANHSFWQRATLGLGGLSASNALTYVSIFILLLALLSLLIALVTPRVALKPLFTLLLVIAAGASYFMDNYGAIIDRHALQSAFESDARESAEWLSFGMLWPFIKVALLPALVLWGVIELKPQPFAKALKRRVLFVAVCAALVAGVIGFRYQPLASLARNHAELRDLLNPLNVINATRTYIKKTGRTLPSVIAPIAADAVRGPSWTRQNANALSGADQAAGQAPVARKPTLLVFVLGESARAASFGLLSGGRNTTPELAKWPITLFSQTDSCGTNTATSVPCLFSNLGRANYDELQANSQENLLDILQRLGFQIEWIDNNTGSKNVARRVKEVDVAHRTDPKYCVADGCHDDMLVDELRQRLPNIKTDTVLVLHMLGSHGPAYFQRYPEAFARFTPICKSVELHNCSAAELKNSYDNTILYTDFVVANMLTALNQTPALETALLFVSDHGESTGESGFFLHGAPYAIAPIEQTRVPMFWWFSPEFSARRGLIASCLEQTRHTATSHDAVFPMVLRAMDIQTSAYRADLDPLAPCYAQN